MKHKTVIADENLPTRLPLVSTLTFAVALDHWHAPGWLWGVFATIFVIVWLGSAAARWREDQKDIFRKEKQE